MADPAKCRTPRGKIENLTNAGKGRKKGVPNKTTTLAKQAIADAFDGLGGTPALIKWAKSSEDNRRVFYTAIWPKIIPVQTELTGANGGPVEIEQKVRENADAVTSAIAGLAERARAAAVDSETQH